MRLGSLTSMEFCMVSNVQLVEIIRNTQPCTDSKGSTYAHNDEPVPGTDTRVRDSTAPVFRRLELYFQLSLYSARKQDTEKMLIKGVTWTLTYHATFNSSSCFSQSSKLSQAIHLKAVLCLR